jgi:hypothetical protein
MTQQYNPWPLLEQAQNRCADLAASLAIAKNRIAELEKRQPKPKPKPKPKPEPEAAHAAALVEVERLRDALDTLVLVVGLTPIKGNLAALQEAVDNAKAKLGGKP